MIERTSQIMRVYNGLVEHHTYTQRTDPKTLKTQLEHLVYTVYTRKGQIEATDFEHRVDRTA